MQPTANVTNHEILEALSGIRQELVRVEQSLKADIARLDAQQQATTKQLDHMRADLRDIRSNQWWIVGLVFTALLGMVGFVVWDRRTTVAPAQRRIDRLEVALKEVAISDSTVAAALRKTGIL